MTEGRIKDFGKTLKKKPPKVWRLFYFIAEIKAKATLIFRNCVQLRSG
jgi:hypothetical protein